MFNLTLHPNGEVWDIDVPTLDVRNINVVVNLTEQSTFRKVSIQSHGRIPLRTSHGVYMALYRLCAPVSALCMGA